MSGFEAEKAATGAADLEEMTEYSDKLEGRKGLLTLTKKTEVKNAACSGPIEFTDAGLEDLQAEIDRVTTSARAKGIALDKVFFSSPSPGTLANFFRGRLLQGPHQVRGGLGQGHAARVRGDLQVRLDTAGRLSRLGHGSAHQV